MSTCALPSSVLRHRILIAVALWPWITQSEGCDLQHGLSQALATSTLPPYLCWGRVRGCKIGISPLLPRSTCPHWQVWGCCTASGPAAHPRHRCESRGHRAPIWPRSHPPVRKNLLYSCRGQRYHTHNLSMQKGDIAIASQSHPTGMKSTFITRKNKGSVCTGPTQHFNLLISKSQLLPGINETAQKRGILGRGVRQPSSTIFSALTRWVVLSNQRNLLKFQVLHLQKWGPWYLGMCSDGRFKWCNMYENS